MTSGISDEVTRFTVDREQISSISLEHIVVTIVVDDIDFF